MNGDQAHKLKSGVRALGWVFVALFCLFVVVQAVLYFGGPIVARIWNSKSSTMALEIKRIYINPLKLSLRVEEAHLFPKEEEKSSVGHILVPSSEYDLKFWQSLRQKKLVMDIAANEPTLNLKLGVKKPEEDDEKKEEERGAEVSVENRDFFEKLLDLQAKIFANDKLLIRRLDLSGAQVNVSEEERGLLFKIYDTSLQAETLGKEKSSIRQLRLQGATSGGGHFVGSLRFEIKEKPDLDLDFKLEDLDLTHFKKLFSEFAGVDPETGKLSFYVESKAEDAQLAGYAKVLLSNLRFLAPEEEGNQSLKEKILESLAENIKSLLENRKTGDVAWRMPIQGDIKEFETDLYSAALSLLRNAFVEGLRPGLEGRVEFL